MVKIRLANRDDIPRIMLFLDQHWKKGHIMATSQEMFEFQHVEGDEVHYVIAEDDENGQIYGTMGYMPMNHSEHPDIFTMMVITLNHSGHELLGEDIAHYLREKLHTRYCVSVGVRERYAKAIAILEENSVSTLRQYYRLNDRKNYQICRIQEKRISEAEWNKDFQLKEISGKEELSVQLNMLSLDRMKPYRDSSYILHRYCDHPVYAYQSYGIFQNNILQGILIGRENFANDAKCFRIVDYYGDIDKLCYMGSLMDILMQKKDYEYVDFCNYGIDEEIMRKAGFERVGQDANIVPHYFEPYEQKNIEIYVYSNALNDLVLFKAFGDQDRPNKI